MPSALDRIVDLLGRSTTDDRVFPPTVLFEEGWMLRLVLDWFSINRSITHPLSFDDSSRWFSEATLTSTFLPRYRGDSYAEGFTHADGVIGHFYIGGAGSAGLSLLPEATVLKVTEAKMFSSLSAGTSRAPHFNQAARNVACIAEIVRLGGRNPLDLSDLAFFVLAPKQQIERQIFDSAMTVGSIEAVVRERIKTYDEPKAEWFEAAFLPTLRCMRIECLSWEGIVDLIVFHDPAFGADLRQYYASCLEYNQPVKSAR